MTKVCDRRQEAAVIGAGLRAHMLGVDNYMVGAGKGERMRFRTHLRGIRYDAT